MTHSEARGLKLQSPQAQADGDVCHSKTPTTQPQRVIPASRLTGNLPTYSNLRLAWNPGRKTKSILA